MAAVVPRTHPKRAMPERRRGRRGRRGEEKGREGGRIARGAGSWARKATPGDAPPGILGGQADDRQEDFEINLHTWDRSILPE